MAELRAHRETQRSGLALQPAVDRGMRRRQAEKREGLVIELDRTVIPTLAADRPREAVRPQMISNEAIEPLPDDPAGVACPAELRRDRKGVDLPRRHPAPAG